MPPSEGRDAPLATDAAPERRAPAAMWVAAGTVFLGIATVAYVTLRPRPERLPGGRFLDPEGLAIDVQGNVYVADEDENRLYMLDREGRTLASAKHVNGLEGTLTQGDSLVALAPGRVLLCGKHVLVEVQFEEDACRLVRTIGRRGKAPGEFEDLEGIARDVDGTIYVTDEDNRRIQAFAPDGKFLRTWPVEDDPESICVAGDRVYVTFRKACWVGCFSKTGELRFRFGRRGSGPGELRGPEFVSVGPNGKVYVTDQENHRIQVFDAEGNLLFAFGRPGSGPGELDNPEDLAWDPEGNLWVAEGGNNDRVQVFSPEGVSLRIVR